MAIKKIIDWAGNSWIVTGVVLAWFGRRWILAGLVAAGAFFIGTAEQAEQESVYEQYKSELDAMNCGKIAAQINGLDKRLSEIDSERREGMAEHKRQKREAINKGITDDIAWARINDFEEIVTAIYIRKKDEILADYLPRKALEQGAKKKGCFSY